MDWLGTALTLLALWLVASKTDGWRVVGFSLNVVAAAAWAAWALVVVPAPTPLLVVEAAVALVSLRGIIAIVRRSRHNRP